MGPYGPVTVRTVTLRRSQIKHMFERVWRFVGGAGYNFDQTFDRTRVRSKRRRRRPR